jgi:hypothetical protein
MSKYRVYETGAPLCPGPRCIVYFEALCRSRLFLLEDGSLVYGTFSAAAKVYSSYIYLGVGFEHNSLTKKAYFDHLSWLVGTKCIDNIKSGKYLLVERDEERKTKYGEHYYNYIDKNRIVFGEGVISIKAE